MAKTILKDSQERIRRAAEQRVFDVCHTFNEIQTGPNPLTADEIERLVAKRPEVYGVLRACPAKMRTRRAR
jgi:hypothetical protein